MSVGLLATMLLGKQPGYASRMNWLRELHAAAFHQRT
jgi:hypothetical protein